MGWGAALSRAPSSGTWVPENHAHPLQACGHRGPLGWQCAASGPWLMSEPHSAFAMHLTVGRLSALSQAASSCVQWEQSKTISYMTVAWIKMGLF